MIKMTDAKSDTDFIRILKEELGWEVEGPSYTEVPDPRREYVARSM